MTRLTPVIGTGLCLAAIGGGWAAATSAQATPQQQKPPVFRAGVNLVQVDAYPTRDGKIVEGLTAADFEVREDGKPQALENVEFIRIEPNTAIAERRDPNTQQDANAMAADPRNRVFVIYLDYLHLNVEGSYRTRQPLVAMLNRMLTPLDLFGVMTPLLRPRDLMLGRQTGTLEDQLARHWTWGDMSRYLDAEEEVLWRCEQAGTPGALIARRRQEKLYDSLDGLMQHLGSLREARKVLVLFTRGWHMFKREDATYTAARPQVGVDPRGRLSTDPAYGGVDRSRCTTEAMRLNALDSFERIRELLAIANRNNVSIYPVNPGGIEAPTITGGDMVTQWDSIRDRWQMLLTLAENTDGIAVNSNDLGADLRRIADDVSAFYVLSYYSTNTTRDGKYRRIDVKMRPPGVNVKARRGYVAPDDTPPPSSAPPPAAASGAEGAVKDALAALTRLRPAAEVFTAASRTRDTLTVVAELPADLLFSGQWKGGAAVAVTVTDAAGAQMGTGAARIEPPSRGAIVTIPVADPSAALVVATRVSNDSQSLADRIEVAPASSSLIGPAMLFRARPPASAPLHPAADPQFRRTERLHVEWPIAGALDQRQARLLGKNGAPLPIPLTVSERDGRVVLDFNLAPLTAGDYVLELIAARGADTGRSLIAFRVVR